MKKHWTEFLPEAGKSIELFNNRRRNMLQNIMNLENEIIEIKNTMRIDEEKFENVIKTQWNSYEIDEAKSQAKRQTDIHPSVKRILENAKNSIGKK